MAALRPEQFRNIVLVGHTGAGKTSLAEALLFRAGVTTRLGSIQEGTSILDHSEEEREKRSSLESGLCFLPHRDIHVNLIDTPGVSEFCGTALSGLAAAECAVAVVSASAGIQVNTRKMITRAREFGLAVWIVINHIDAPNVDLPNLVTQIQESFGPQCVPLNLPAGGGKSVIDCFANQSGQADFGDVSAAHVAIIEAIVAADDELMERYLGGELGDEEVKATAARAVARGQCIPILFADSCHDVGITEFLDALISFCPSPLTGKQRIFEQEDEQITLAPDDSGRFVGQVFKISVEAKSHIKYLSVRVFSGKLTPDMTIKSTSDPKGTRPGQLMRIIGPDHKELDAAIAGDIIALAKLDLAIGDVLSSDKVGSIAMPVFPKPMFALAVESKSRGDEDKIGTALRKFAEEDPCFQIDRGDAGELVVRGMGEQQLRTYLHHMAVHNKLQVDTKPPKIAYRETVLGRADNVEYTHKKQTGGAGQFARVFVNLYAAERGEGYEFIDKIFGGAIDQPFRPSVDKGIRAQLKEGVLAGYPVVDVKVELIDGKTHPVDSKDIAFQIAGREVFKEAFMKAKPTLLEPIVTLEVTIPADNVGDIQGDLASRRGRPQGQDMLPGNMAQITGVVPLAELADYSSRLSSITGGQGSYTMEFSHYEIVPGNVQQQIIDQHKAEVAARH